MDTESPESPSTADALDPMARRLFLTALQQNRCGELLDCLHEGGTATVLQDGSMMLIPASLIAEAMETLQ